MGNTAIKEYDLNENQVASGGIKNCWRVYSATNKVTGEEVSVFVLRKYDLPRNLRDEKFYDLLRLETSIMIKIKHPSILAVLQPLEETRNEFFMVTEPVSYCLANVVGDKRNLPEKSWKFLDMSEIEIKNGLRQVAEGVIHCNKDLKLYHCNITISNIYITSDRNWKLAGFSHAREQLERESFAVGWDYSHISEDTEYLFPDLRFAAPEVVLSKKVTPLTDTFSFAMVVLLIHQFKHYSNEIRSINTLEEYQAFAKELKTDFLKNLPIKQSLRYLLKKLLSFSARERMELRHFLDSEYFSEPALKILEQIQKIEKKDLETQENILKGLIPMMETMDKQMIELLFLSRLVDLIHDDKLCNHALIPIFWIMKNLNCKRLFEKKILPEITKFLHKAKIHKLMTKRILMENWENMVSLSSEEALKDVLIPFLIECLESNNTRLLISSLQNSKALLEKLPPSLAPKFPIQTLLPSVKSLCLVPLESNTKSLRVNAMLVLAEIGARFGNDHIIREIVECSNSAVLLEPCKAVIMTQLGTLRILGCQSNTRGISQVILPKVVQLVSFECLDQTQVSKIFEYIDECLEKIRKAYLKEGNVSNAPNGVESSQTDIEKSTNPLDFLEK